MEEADAELGARERPDDEQEDGVDRDEERGERSRRPVAAAGVPSEQEQRRGGDDERHEREVEPETRERPPRPARDLEHVVRAPEVGVAGERVSERRAHGHRERRAPEHEEQGPEPPDVRARDESSATGEEGAQREREHERTPERRELEAESRGERERGERAELREHGRPLEARGGTRGAPACRRRRRRPPS